MAQERLGKSVKMMIQCKKLSCEALGRGALLACALVLLSGTTACEFLLKYTPVPSYESSAPGRPSSAPSLQYGEALDGNRGGSELSIP